MDILSLTFEGNSFDLPGYISMISGNPDSYGVKIGFFCWEDDNFV